MQICNHFDFRLTKRQQVQFTVLALVGVFQIVKFAGKRLRESRMAKKGVLKIQ